MGRDIRDYKIEDLRSRLGMVMQEPALMNCTIKENILYGLKNASNQMIIEAADDSNCSRFIKEHEVKSDRKLILENYLQIESKVGSDQLSKYLEYLEEVIKVEEEQKQERDTRD